MMNWYQLIKFNIEKSDRLISTYIDAMMNYIREIRIDFIYALN